MLDRDEMDYTDQGGAAEDMGEEREARAASGDARPAGRLPYEKPAVTWDQPLETQPGLMSGCQKLPGGDPSCTAVGPLYS